MDNFRQFTCFYNYISIIHQILPLGLMVRFVAQCISLVFLSLSRYLVAFLALMVLLAFGIVHLGDQDIWACLDAHNGLQFLSQCLNQ